MSREADPAQRTARSRLIDVLSANQGVPQHTASLAHAANCDLSEVVTEMAALEQEELVVESRGYADCMKWRLR